MKPLFCLFLMLLNTAFDVKAQGKTLDSLVQVKSQQLLIYHSQGREKRALEIVPRVEKAMNFYREMLQTSPEVKLLILTEEDWPSFTDAPVYGMPHYDDDKTLIIAADDNPFWSSLIPPLQQLPDSLAERVRKTYTEADGKLSMKAFFDLLALHELGHAFHFQAGLNMQRAWMGELFVNMLLHCFVAENEPAQLPALTVFPQMVVAAGSSQFKFTKLQDIQERYDEIGRNYPQNYGWYQCRWHSGAASMYDAAGCNLTTQTWKALQQQKQKLDDAELLEYLDKNQLIPLAEFIRKW